MMNEILDSILSDIYEIDRAKASGAIAEEFFRKLGKEIANYSLMAILTLNPFKTDFDSAKILLQKPNKSVTTTAPYSNSEAENENINYNGLKLESAFQNSLRKKEDKITADELKIAST